MAHKIESKERTQDVLTQSDKTFSTFALKGCIKNGLIRCGYINPSPIQLLSIPEALIGMDLVIQAKSGTGKTVVFAVTALQTLSLPSTSPQVLIISPTREIATQIAECINQIGRVTEGLNVKTFIGGVDLQVDKKSLKNCNVVVGTPGRIKQLLDTKMLKPDTIRLLVIDEADKLMETPFVGDVNIIIGYLPKRKQMIASSATYPVNLSKFLTKYMSSPKEIRLGSEDPSLIGVSQFHSMVGSEREKNTLVVEILDSIPFSQAMIFYNNREKSKTLLELLIVKGHAAGCISGEMTTKERSRKMEEFKSKNLRVLISTDLCSRGIDAEHVNLVLNLDNPFGSSTLETYLHRIGRSGRFGSTGTAITILTEESHEAKRFFKLVCENDLRVTKFSGYISNVSSHAKDYQDYLEALESGVNPTDQSQSAIAEIKTSHKYEEFSMRRTTIKQERETKKYPQINLINRKNRIKSDEGQSSTVKRIKLDSDNILVQNMVEQSFLELEPRQEQTFDFPSSNISANQVIEAVFPGKSVEEWKEKNLSMFVHFLNPESNVTCIKQHEV